MRPHFITMSRLAMYAAIVTGLAGCNGMKAVHSSDNVDQKLVMQKDEREKLWQDNKDWLLSRMPKAGSLVRDIVSALEETTDSRHSCSGSVDDGCDKLLNLVRQKMSLYRLLQLPDEHMRFALLDGDTAYVFRISDWTFSGIANLATAIYFTAPDVPLKRTDGRTFAFVADDKNDMTTLWKIYRRNILHSERDVPLLGEYTLTRAELDAAGVPKQIDLLTPQQREERELAKQGRVWRKRAQMLAIRICSDKQEQRSGSRKADGRGGRGKHNRTASPESTTSGSTPLYAMTMAEALQGKAHLNCNAGSGYLVTEDGIAAEVYRLIKSKEGIDAIIAATAMEIPNGILQYRYPADQDNNDILKPDAGKEMILQIKPMKGSNELTLRLNADTGISAGFLVLAGEWYLDPDYRIQGKNISNSEFSTLFIRAFRDCAMKDAQGSCRSLPDLFMSLQNPLIAKEYVQYLLDHYLSGADKARSN